MGVAAIVNGRIEIDGTPFFPFGLYHVSHAGTATQLMDDLNTIADGGFNVIHATYRSSLNYGAFLDQAATRGVRVISENDATSAGLTVLTSNFKTKPAVLGWNISDDVDNGTHSVASIEALHNQAHSEDANHITYVSGFRPTYLVGGHHLEDYLGVVDVAAMQSYPISNGDVNDTWEVDDSVMAVGAGSHVPILSNNQSFSWAAQRYPTAAEGRNMAYQSLAAGAKGIIFYTFFDGTTYLPTGASALWTELQSEAAEINILAPALLNGLYTRALIDLAGDRFASYWVYQKKVYVVVVNTSTSSAKTYSLTMPAGTTGPAQSLFPGRPSGMTFSAGVLSGTVQPLDVHVYTLVALAIQYLVPGIGYINDSGATREYLVPGGAYLNEAAEVEAPPPDQHPFAGRRYLIKLAPVRWG